LAGKRPKGLSTISLRYCKIKMRRKFRRIFYNAASEHLALYAQIRRFVSKSPHSFLWGLCLFSFVFANQNRVDLVQSLSKVSDGVVAYSKRSFGKICPNVCGSYLSNKTRTLDTLYEISLTEEIHNYQR